MDKETLLRKIQSVKLCLMVHPDYEPDSEFEDRIDDLQEIEDSLIVSDKTKEQLAYEVCQAHSQVDKFGAADPLVMECMLDFYNQRESQLNKEYARLQIEKDRERVKQSARVKVTISGCPLDVRSYYQRGRLSRQAWFHHHNKR